MEKPRFLEIVDTDNYTHFINVSQIVSIKAFPSNNCLIILITGEKIQVSESAERVIDLI